MFENVDGDADGIAEVRCGGHHGDDEHHDDAAGHVGGAFGEGIPMYGNAPPACAVAGGVCDCCCIIGDIAGYALDWPYPLALAPCCCCCRGS